MQKIVINACHGGFGLSQKAMERYAELKGFKLITESRGLYSINYYADSISDENMISDYNMKRNDPDLVRVVEALGKSADDVHAELRVVEVPDDVDWVIEEYDGLEWVAEVHRTWS
jgi:hypothetical protein